MRLECDWNVCDPTGTQTFCKRKILQLFIYLYQRIRHGLFVLPNGLVSFVGFPDGILLKSISDRYRPDRNPDIDLRFCSVTVVVSVSCLFTFTGS